MMEPGVKWGFNAWSESVLPGRKGSPAWWAIYMFDSEKKAIRERDRLERKWKKLKDGKEYRFEIYRVETTWVAR